MRLELHTTRAKHFLKRAKTELHVKEVERIFLLFLSSFGILLAIVLHHRLSQSQVVVFFGSENEGCYYVIVTNLSANDVATCFVVIFGLSNDVAGILQVGSVFAFFQVVIVLGHCGMNAIAHFHAIFLIILVHGTLVGDRRWRWQCRLRILSMHNSSCHDINHHAKQQPCNVSIISQFKKIHVNNLASEHR